MVDNINFNRRVEADLYDSQKVFQYMYLIF